MNITGNFTKKGLNLSAKFLTGASLTITRVVAGSGNTANPSTAEALPQIRQTLAVNTSTHSGNTATIPVTLAAAQAAENYTLTELGVYARDPEEGEILYKVYKLSEPVDIVAGSRMVLRFYLEETVSQDLNVTVACSPAGLITEEMFQPVSRTRVPIREYTMDINEVQSFLDGLPRLLTEGVSITVSGTLTSQLTISDFYGSGNLWIHAETLGACVIQNAVRIDNCKAQVELSSLQLEQVDTIGAEGLLWVTRSPYVKVIDCTLTGCTGAVYGAGAKDGSAMFFEGGFVSGFQIAVFAGEQSKTYVQGTSGNTNAFQNNTTGAYVWNGGVMLLGNNVPDLLGGSANLKQGGMIVKADGTLL